MKAVLLADTVFLTKLNAQQAQSPPACQFFEVSESSAPEYSAWRCAGATHYIEPVPMIALNNAEARLEADETAEEEHVLGLLSGVVADHAAGIMQVRDGLRQVLRLEHLNHGRP